MGSAIVGQHVEAFGNETQRKTISALPIVAHTVQVDDETSSTLGGSE